MEQLVIPNFTRPNVTIKQVMEYIATSVPPVYLRPSKRELRLAIDLAKQMNPLFDFNVKEQVDLIRGIVRYDVEENNILSVKSFKEILFTEIIVSVKCKRDNTYKVKLKKVLRTNF